MDTKKLLEMYEIYMVSTKNRSKNTMRGYLTDLRQFVEYAGNPLSLKRVDILNYINEISPKFAPATVQRKVATIQTLYSFMMEYGLIQENISTKLPTPSIPKTIINCPDSVTIEKMIEEEPLDAIKIALELGSFTAMRASEVCNLKIEDIDFDKSTCILRDTKTAKSRLVAIESKTLEHIKRYLKTNGLSQGCLLRTKNGKPWGERNFSKYIQKNTYKDFHFHLCRHYCLTELANNHGVHIAKEMAGHTSILTTQKYLHPSANTLLNAVNGARK